jgi:hypothetical protein
MVAKGKGTVKFFDGRSMDEVDLSVAGAAKGAYVEVFGNLALGVLSAAQAKVRLREWEAVRRGMRAVEEGR